MATKLKRISVCLPPEVEHALNELREASGIAPASFITQIITESLPMIQAMSQAHRALKHDQADAFDVLANALASAMHQGTETQLQLIETTRKVRRTAGVVGKRRKPAQ